LEVLVSVGLVCGVAVAVVVAAAGVVVVAVDVAESNDTVGVDVEHSLQELLSYPWCTVDRESRLFPSA